MKLITIEKKFICRYCNHIHAKRYKALEIFGLILIIPFTRKNVKEENSEEE